MRTIVILKKVPLILFVFFSACLPILAQVSSDPLSTSSLKMRSLEELMDIDITIVSKRPERWFDAPASVFVITGDDIRRFGASSIPEALRLADNLNVAQQNQHDWAVSARGFNASLSNKLLVLIDGRAVYRPLYGGVLWNVQDYLLKDIDRIEVISGPGGTVWGANAVNGVINIITKKTDDTQGTYLTTGGGTELQDFAGVRYGGTLAPGFNFRIYAKYLDRAKGKLATGSDASNSGRRGQGGFRIDTESSPRNNFTLQGDYYSGNELQVGADKEVVKGGNVLGRWTHTISDESDFSLQLYYDRTHLSFPYGAPVGTLIDDLHTYDFDFQHRLSLDENHTLVWGIGYRFTREAEKNAVYVRFIPDVLEHNLFNVFMQDEIAIVENLFFTIGTKVEHNDYTGFEFEPSSRLRWNITSEQILWGAVSRAVRTPSRFDRDYEFPTLIYPPPLDFVQIRGKNFISETVIAYELGYRSQFDSRVSASVSFFYNIYDDLRSTTPGPAANFFLPSVFENNLEGETYGMEISTNYQMFDSWFLHGGYNLLINDIRVKPGHVDANNALNETADPQQQLFIRSSVDLPIDIEFDAAFRFVDRITINNGPIAGSVPAYIEMDIHVGWHPAQNFEIAVVGQNLLSRHHPEFGFPGALRQEIQRGVYGKVSLTL